MFILNGRLISVTSAFILWEAILVCLRCEPQSKHIRRASFQFALLCEVGSLSRPRIGFWSCLGRQTLARRIVLICRYLLPFNAQCYDVYSTALDYQCMRLCIVASSRNFHRYISASVLSSVMLLQVISKHLCTWHGYFLGYFWLVSCHLT